MGLQHHLIMFSGRVCGDSCVGEDAKRLNNMVRADPGHAYDYGEDPKTVIRPPAGDEGVV